MLLLLNDGAKSRSEVHKSRPTMSETSMRCSHGWPSLRWTKWKETCSDYGDTRRQIQRRRNSSLNRQLLIYSDLTSMDWDPFNSETPDVLVRFARDLRTLLKVFNYWQKHLRLLERKDWAIVVQRSDESYFSRHQRLCRMGCKFWWKAQSTVGSSPVSGNE